ncbi:ribonucleotide-diphosphate reductase subunit beta [Amnibacterium setariae]|uniref:Ribonucleotide-diphosphate reductase subunit beta n=1 Tax=Amnibacterium setariae TaxID=2306585 RepID=A0A3A1U8G7_9MICO|nr:ribonucleotide-diphosphate reductase subunit beta [Amnibacterium setariae]RIX31358.1 ribonucleotide-diphosphate reductase subunit beta [Amnibacterium setariae]
MFDDEGDQVDGTDFISGYSVPMDPMDLLQCDSCQ